MKHIKLFESYIAEKMVSISEVLPDSLQQGLVVYKSKRGGAEKIHLTLYDFDDDVVLGYFMGMRYSSDDFYEVHNVFGQKNFGPLMYDLAMMSAHPHSLKPDIYIKPAALNIWKYYLEKRQDVTKSKLPEDSTSFVSRYQESPDGQYLYDRGALDIINTKFSLKPNEEYNELVNTGNDRLKKYNLTKQKVTTIGIGAFSRAYNS